MTDTHTPTGADGRALSPRGQRTRERILEAGREVFLERGFHAATVDDIVAVAGISHGTFYLYFASKAALFEQLVAAVATEMMLLVADAPKRIDGTAGREALRSWVDRVAALYERFGAVVATWTEAELSGRPIGALGDDVIGGLASALANHARIPKGSDLDPAIASLAIIAMTERLLYHHATHQIRARREEIVDLVTDVIIAGLLPPRPPSARRAGSGFA